MASQLQEILRTLCDGTEWCYAIFWRLKDEVLERKEGYCRPRDLPPCELSSEAQASDACIERASDKTAYHIHNTRNGIIRHVALSNIHLWIFNSRVIGHPSELYEQFAAGIQTVAVISVHQGVVQLGSMNLTAEDSSFIAYLKALFSKDMRAQEGIVGTLTAKSEIGVNHTKISQTVPSEAATEGFTEMPHAWTAGALAEEESAVGIILRELIISELSPADEQQAEHLLKSIVRPQDFLPDHDFGANVQSLQSQYFVAYGQTLAKSTDRASESKEEAIDVKNKQMRCHNSNPMHSQEAGDSEMIVTATVERHLPSFWDAANQEPEEGMTASCLTDETETFQMGTSYSIKTGQRNDLQVIGHEGPAKDIESLAANTKHGGAHHKVPQKLITPRKSRTLQGDLSADDPPTTSRANKKRTRQNGKPIKRLKDRQRIQDCLYELRSIIPSSGKCSIDALLEKTIKYMSFLQSMAEDNGMFSDDNGNSEVQGTEAAQCSRSNDQKTGASWVLELSGYGGICPVLVEDLKGPQQMSVQMLCEEEGLFLEIAQTLRGLGLKILKSQLECKDEKMWARLVVEGNGHVQRLHITWSLVQLLESKQAQKTSQWQLGIVLGQYF